MEDLKVSNPDLDGAELRDIGLPLDVRVLAVRRDGAQLISHGYTHLHLGDIVTVMGSRDSLEQVARSLEE